MAKTHLTIEGEKFLIDEKLTYSDIDGTRASVHGLLMNARFIQGIFDDAMEPEGMAALLDLARKESGGLPCGCSGGGSYHNREVAEASDVIHLGDGEVIEKTVQC